MPAQLVRLEFDHEGFKEVLTSPGVHGVLLDIAQAIDEDATARAGLDETAFSSEVIEAAAVTKYKFPGRYLGIVSATSPEGRKAQAEDKALSTAAVQPREV